MVDRSINPVTVVIRQLRPEFKFPAKIDLSFSQILAIRRYYNEFKKQP